MPATHNIEILREAGIELASELSDRQRRHRYPTKLIRYLIAYEYLKQERARQGRPLRVCEIGIDRGQMLRFVHAASRIDYPDNTLLDVWDGIDVDISRCQGSYTRLIKANLQCDDIYGEYDVVILLHVLEHLLSPQAAVEQLVRSLNTTRAYIIGVPCHLPILRAFRQSQLRKHTNWNGHVSAFSRASLRRMLRDSGLAVTAEDGAFFLRWSGSLIEKYPDWQRMNRQLASLIPGWPGEYYCVARPLAHA